METLGSLETLRTHMQASLGSALVSLRTLASLAASLGLTGNTGITGVTAFHEKLRTTGNTQSGIMDHLNFFGGYKEEA